MHALQPEIFTNTPESESDPSTLTLETDTELSDIANTAGNYEVIAIHFNAFADGRGFSLARLLRERLNYQGKIRAVGDFLPDQMHYLARCGFNSFALPDGTKQETAKQCLKAFTEAYQISWDRKEPLFKRL
ncbi:DUF934 domain-containing protein [Sansalvadorimonas verongulae]|uniref:DUF934 domain-containing protein n=1 Tax=Sansalvadorimonas verongulae TaxID=2172824 RepID=UPI0012BC26A1|nr:DUF934 domain-containing protein [Sansalvadorimonas verongulae]MTI12506.1 DUF934 domain-containing protein [Sansalvadorimonas verongulae]